MKQKPQRHRLTELEQFLGVVFIFLAITAAFFPYFNLDVQISELIQSVSTPGFAQVMWFVSFLGNQPWMEIILGTSFFLFLKQKMRLEAVVSLFSVATGVAAGSLVKIIIHRPRPEADMIKVLVSLTDKSFPSNHTLIFTIYFGFLLYLSLYVFENKYLKLVVSSISIFMGAFIGISRIFLGAHWASDVLGGYILGTVILLLTIQLYRSIKAR